MQRSMIRDYQIIEFIEKPSSNYSLFKVQNNGALYFLHEFTSINECDEYNFKVIKKLVTSNHVTKIYQKFTQHNKTYFVSQYFPSNLLKQQLRQPNQIFEYSQALKIFTKIIQLIEEIHQNKVIHRNIRLQMIDFKENEIYLSDFTLSQVVKRKERYFKIVGVKNYLAPEFYMQDGYGFQIDIWSAGICLYFMLTGTFPFNFQNKNNEQIMEEINSKCRKGFIFENNPADLKKGKLMKVYKHIQDLFTKLFQIDYTERITVTELKTHPALKEYFGNGNLKENPSQLSVIEEQKSMMYSSIFVSMLRTFPCHFQFHKQEIIFDFLEHSSEMFMLESPHLISQQIRTLVSFSILKIAVLKVNNLLNVLSDKKKPQFKIDPQEWQHLRKTAGFSKVKLKIEKKKKILDMLFRAACLNVQNFKQKSSFYSDQIPQDFNAMKHEYRQNLSAMFEIQKQILKKNGSKQNYRRTCENLARLTILCMINRIFKQSGVRKDFEIYFKWSKKQSLEDLEEWIESEKVKNLKVFVKNITNKYMD